MSKQFIDIDMPQRFTEYCIVKDGDSNQYMIPLSKKNDWHKYEFHCGSIPPYAIPSYATCLPDSVSFFFPKLNGEFINESLIDYME